MTTAPTVARDHHSPAPSDDLREAMASGEISSYLQVANIPSLLAVLFQLTGDHKWLSDPYLPRRTRGLEDNDSGGLPEELQADIRAAAAAALARWAAGAPIAVPSPVDATLVALMTANVGEPVSPDYEPMMAAEMGFRAVEATSIGADSATDFLAVIVGAGVSGMAAAISFQRAGIPFVILEKNQQVGGTWLENRYPGCGVDTPSYLYSFSFQPRAWSTHFGKRDEVETYLQDVATEHDLYQHIEFGTSVTGLDWQPESDTWRVSATGPDGRTVTLTANVVVTAVGQLNRPKVPSIPGIDHFSGPIFHSAQWPDGLDVRGKRVAVIGTGASAMQIVPAIGDQAGELFVFQRSPQWVAPNDNYFRPVDARVHWLLENLPYYHSWYRFRLAWNFNDKIHATLTVDPEWPSGASINAANDGHRRHLTRYIEGQLEGRPDLLEKALPTYPPFGKRMLLDNGWYRTLRQPHVHLETDAVERLSTTGVVTADGREHDVDIVVFATGFDAQRLLFPLEVRANGRSLRDEWGDDDPRAYLGMATPGFPNLFFLYGPNTNLGHGGSWITMAECQAHYLSELLVAMVQDDIGSLECREAPFTTYNERLDAAHARMVWTHPGMQNWYRNAAGRIVTNSPWRVADYWTMTQQVALDDYEQTPRVHG